MKNIIGIILLLGVVGLIIFSSRGGDKSANYKDIEYSIEGQSVKLEGGTRYFGNELLADLNGDGVEDVAFIVSHEREAGTFYYAVAAVKTENGYVGSDGYLLGDRIAPQSIDVSPNPKHKNVIVVNYADTTVEPSVGKSAYLKLGNDMRWGIVEPDFEGESDFSLITRKPWTWVSALYNDGRTIMPKQADKFVLTFSNDGRFTATTDCNHLSGGYIANADSIAFSDIAMTKMFCEGSQETEFVSLLETSSDYHFTEEGSLILDLKFDSGSAVFK